MTYQSDCILPPKLLEQIESQVFDFLHELIMINSAIQAGHMQYLNGAHYQHTPDHCGHPNGYKPKVVKNRLGEILRTSLKSVRDAFTQKQLRKGCAANEHLP